MRVSPHRLFIFSLALFLFSIFSPGVAAASSRTAVPFSFSAFARYLFPRQLDLVVFCLGLLMFFIFLWQAVSLSRSKEQMLRENEAMLKALTDNLNGGVVSLMQNKHASITYANEGFWNLLGLPVPQAAPALPALLNWVRPEDRAGFLSAFCSVRSPGEHTVAELDLLRADGTALLVLLRGTLSVFKGTPLLFCVIVDIREQKELQRHLETEHERYQVLIEQSDAIIFDANIETGATVCSGRFQEVFGRPAQPLSVLADICAAEHIYPEDRAALLRLQMEATGDRPAGTVRIRLQRADGEYLWCDLALHGMCSKGKLTRLIGKIRVVDDQVKEHLRLEMLSRIDQLTGVYRKEAFQFLAQNALSENLAEESVLFFIDLDNFKEFNDRLGHIQGDEALRATARIICNIFRENDLVGRFGGDEFYVFAQHMPLRVIKEKAEALCRSLRQEFPLPDGERLTVTASVGIARSPDDSLSFRELLDKADKALYAAKSTGKSKFCLYGETIVLSSSFSLPTKQEG